MQSDSVKLVNRVNVFTYLKKLVLIPRRRSENFFRTSVREKCAYFWICKDVDSIHQFH